MTSFTDGPAAGVVLRIRRAPLYLRVTRMTGGPPGGQEWDALDQLDDRPHPAETLYAYRLVSSEGMIHINSRDRKTGRHTGGTFAMATYAVVEPQPDDAVMRDNRRWAEWAMARAAEEKPVGEGG